MTKSKILVAFFSASGTTAKAAKKVADVLQADLFEIEPVQPYTAADLDWNNQDSRSSVEMKNPDSRPEIASRVEDMKKYDAVLIGFPIWWYVAPTIINTFLESYDFSEKSIVLFATSGGSEMGKTAQLLKPLTSSTAVWKGAKRLNGENDAEQWAKSLKL